MRRKNVKAWLITWEGDHDRDDNVAMLLHPGIVEGRVADLMALLYANEYGSFSERVVYAMERDPFHHPYRARLGSRDGRELAGHLVCGRNPYLYGRRVERVTVLEGDDGTQSLQWSEIET